MSIVITKDSRVVLIMQGQVVSDAMRSFFGWGYTPRLDLPPITIISMNLFTMHTQ
nr:hypothetical protein [Photobacterium frigidiphilum]